jgi:hypothetical protein
MYFNSSKKTTMNNKPCLLIICSIFSLSLFSFRNKIENSKYVVLVNHVKLDSGGRPVSLDSAQACIDRFTVEMKKHGFSDMAGEDVNIHIKKTSQITTGESFSGASLQQWLNETAAAYAAAGKTLMINIQLGIYDSSYLKTYDTNVASRKASVNRIAVFLIPYDASTPGVSARTLITPNGASSGSGGGTGFDFGGLQP